MPGDGGKRVKLHNGTTGNLDRVVFNTLARHYVETETRLQADVEPILEIVASSGSAVVRAQLIIVATVHSS